MRRRYLFDAPTNGTVQVRARLNSWYRAKPHLFEPTDGYQTAPLTPDDLSPEDQAIFLIENDAAFGMSDAARDALNEDDPKQDPPYIAYLRDAVKGDRPIDLAGDEDLDF